jgi:hypothetical protein
VPVVVAPHPPAPFSARLWAGAHVPVKTERPTTVAPDGSVAPTATADCVAVFRTPPAYSSVSGRDTPGVPKDSTNQPVVSSSHACGTALRRPRGSSRVGAPSAAAARSLKSGRTSSE